MENIGRFEIVKIGEVTFDPVTQELQYENGLDTPTEIADWIEAEVNISSTQILANSVNEILPAPSSGSYYIVDEIIVKNNYNTKDYSYTSARIYGSSIAAVDLGSEIFAFGEDTVMWFRNMQTKSPIVFPTDAIQLEILDGKALPSRGNGSVTVKIKYKVQTM